MSCASIGLSFLPTATLNVSTVKLNKSTKGAGPDARPPKVFNGAPASLTLDTSHFGMWPPYSKDISSLKDLAHPNLESATTIVVSVSYNSSGIVGSFFTYSSSTENHTPVPFMRTYSISSNDLM